MKFEKMVVKSNQEEAIQDLTTEYPYVMHYANLRDIVIPWHWHEEVEFDYVVSGEIEVLTTNGKYVFHKNQGFFINSNVLCSMGKSPQADAGVMNSHLFHPVFLGGHFRSVFQTKYLAPVLQNRNIDILELRESTQVQRKILEKLRQVSFLQREKDVEFQTRNIFSEIWLLLLEEISTLPRDAHGVNLQNQDRMQSMMSYIHRNYMEKVTLEEIASSASISSRECLRCFRNTINKSPVEYLMDYRLEMAGRLLRETNMSITEIGLQTGFSSNAYFGKVFRERCGITPAEYRKNKQVTGW